MNKRLILSLAAVVFLSSVLAFALTKKPPVQTGEQNDSVITPSAPGSPPELRSTQDTRLEAGKAIEPGRSPLQPGEEAFDLHAIDPKTGELVPTAVPKK